jgi:hypothetical protein
LAKCFGPSTGWQPNTNASKDNDEQCSIPHYKPAHASSHHSLLYWMSLVDWL